MARAVEKQKSRGITLVFIKVFKGGQSYLESGWRHTVIMTRLKVGYCRLAQDLYKIGKHQDSVDLVRNDKL